jgi:hypothetical protein
MYMYPIGILKYLHQEKEQEFLHVALTSANCMHSPPFPLHCPYYLLWISLRGDKNEKIVLKFENNLLILKINKKIEFLIL